MITYRFHRRFLEKKQCHQKVQRLKNLKMNDDMMTIKEQ